MRVLGLNVRGFRNLASVEVALGDGITLLWGANAAGKTNLLEALYCGLVGRSCRTRRDRETIAFGETLARAETSVLEGAETRRFLYSISREGERRHLLDGAPLRSTGDPSRPPVAVFMPDRLTLVKGPPAARRAHIDRFCAALWPARAELRSRYGRALAQRNALLGRIRGGAAGSSSLDAWDLELARVGVELAAARAEAVELLAAAFSTAGEDLGLEAGAAMRYMPRSEAYEAEALAAELGSRRASDRARGFTGHGPHLDEIALTLGGRPVRRYGSQGEQRATLLALLFAEREALLEARREPPLMLLDDVMSELDPERRRRLGHRLRAGGGQAVITATEPAHLPGELERSEVALREGRPIAVVHEAGRGAVVPRKWAG